jgi:HK97 gp10 family phage protein
MDIEFKLDGAKEFSNLLRKLPTEMELSAVQSGLIAASNVLKKAVQQKAPVYKGRGHATRTTQMWKNTGSNATVLPGTLKRSVVVRKNRKNKLSRLVGTGRAFYAHFLEYGTKAHKIVASRHRPHRFPKRMTGAERSASQRSMPGALADSTTGTFFGREVRHPGARKKPFMIPAMEAARNEMVSAFGKGLARGIDREAGKWILKYRVRT